MNVFSAKFNRRLFFLILFSLSTSLSIFTAPVDNRNYFLIGMMFLGPLIVLLSGRFLRKIDIPIISLVVLIFCTQLFFNPSSFRASTVMFSCMFFFYFLAAVRVFISSKMRYVQLLAMLKWLIIAYCVVLIVQQLSFIVGLPIPNHIMGGEIGERFNALAAEPSHTTRFVGVLFYSYLIIADRFSGQAVSMINSFRQNRLVWICALYVMIASLSATGMFVLALIMTKYISKKNCIIVAALLVAVFAIGVNSDFKPLHRSTVFLEAAVTGDYDKMIKADHSASIRVVPVIMCIKRINVFSLRSWVGEGIDSVKSWFYMKGVKKGTAGGAMASYTVEYGLLVALLFLCFSFWCCYDPQHKLPTIGLWVLCVFMIGVNTQIGWMCILMLFIDKRYRVNNENKGFLQQTA